MGEIEVILSEIRDEIKALKDLLGQYSRPMYFISGVDPAVDWSQSKVVTQTVVVSGEGKNNPLYINGLPYYGELKETACQNCDENCPVCNKGNYDPINTVNK